MVGIAAVTVPVYKAHPSADEKASFLQLLSVLGRHRIVVFTHEELDLTEYSALAGDLIFEVVYFAREYFKSIDGYNRLLCSPVFYEKFDSYKFVLIYQLDAWVFKDELLYWCDLDYDFIGAPWFASPPNEDLPGAFTGIGNGGFSLRKISAHLKALKSFYYLLPANRLLLDFFRGKIGRFGLKMLYKDLVRHNSTHYSVRPAGGLMNEDVFWGLVIKRNFKWFRAPDVITASRFSLEVNSRKYYELNGRRLPFGCHAWRVYEPEFWEKHIQPDKF
jgi:hypothetical protein